MPQDCKALVDLLTTEPTLDPLSIMIRAIGQFKTIEVEQSRETILSTINAVYSLRIIFLALRNTATRTAKAYLEASLQTMGDNWPLVLGGMANLTRHAQNRRDWQLQRGCVDTILAVLFGLVENPSIVDMTSMPGTAQLIFEFLTTFDQDTQRFSFLRFAFDEPNMHCPLTKLFKCMVESEVGRECMESTLLSYNGAIIKGMVHNFHKRAREIALDADERDMKGNAESLDYLFQGIFGLTGRAVWVHYEREDVVKLCGDALYTLANKAQAYTTSRLIWDSISSATFQITRAAIAHCRNSSKAVVTLVSSGVLRTALLCIPHVGANPKPNGAVQTLDLMAPYFYLERVFLAALEHGDVKYHHHFRHVGALKGQAGAIWEGYNTIFSKGYFAHVERGSVPISMCSNSKVRAKAMCGAYAKG